jgi:hypothetical protein
MFHNHVYSQNFQISNSNQPVFDDISIHGGGPAVSGNREGAMYLVEVGNRSRTYVSRY